MNPRLDALGAVFKPILDAIDHLTVSGDQKVALQQTVLQGVMPYRETDVTPRTDHRGRADPAIPAAAPRGTNQDRTRRGRRW
jgi:hypothetical protein